MHINISGNVESIMLEIEGIRSRSIPFAISQAINDTLFGMRQALSDEEKSVFDNPVAFTTNLSAWDIDRATPAYAIGTLRAKPAQDKYLQWQAWGGKRSAQKKAIGIPVVGGDVHAWHGGLRTDWKKVFSDKKTYFSGTPRSSGKMPSGVWKRIIRDGAGGSVKPRARKIKKGSEQVHGLQLILLWKPAVNYANPEFDFEAVAGKFVDSNFDVNFGKRLIQAMRYQLRRP